jgi:hypothetical protein
MSLKKQIDYIEFSDPARRNKKKVGVRGINPSYVDSVES